MKTKKCYIAPELTVTDLTVQGNIMLDLHSTDWEGLDEETELMENGE